ncbi:MAG: ATP-dependent helicase [Candidatus Moeniiplasma glomeromycotorum]|nr:ATP-dependent helicase [Candidatus Moeniiplasma glomeromycotorum]MCE8162242.1 ATP-dependent helicase [Candidatus Moeniiplasma glomeromycotorum]MCE8166102.1 ATP-dependent helicase [Candidatus Moeniiplasma glomeromycotorum]MCE8166641.1 ATP-dependent helicase [Candidatus Moeniiplasma glomeromycotorum]
MNEIKLTEEQKKCAECSLDQKVLVISADPGTGKTEVLKHRVLFIYNHLIKMEIEQSKNQKPKKLILVLAYGRNIAAEIRTKLKTHQLKVYRRFRDLLPRLHRHICTLNECPTYLENQQPLVLVCTIHSLASGINDLVIKQQFQETRKIHVLVATQRVEKKQGLISHEQQNQKFTWKSLGAIKSQKRKLFNYLFRHIEDKYWTEISSKELWGIFIQSKPEMVTLTKTNTPYYHYEVDYSGFLNQISALLPTESELLTKLKESCQQDRIKNVWLEFEDLITNANNLVKQLDQKTWPEFNYILVDECQDLKIETFHLITQAFGSESTKFTFVGDPKQNIYGFAGAQADIFKLLEEQFPHQTNSIIATSFRLTPEIADFANHFIQKFMKNYRASIQTTKPKTSQKPQIIMVGQEPDYQLNSSEMEAIEQELISNSELKRNNLVQSNIRQKKLHRHLDTILPLINQLDKNSSKAILYRQGWIGDLLQKWLNQKCITTNISGRVIDSIIRQIRYNLKILPTEKLKIPTLNQKSEKHFQWLLKSFELEKKDPPKAEFFSLASFLASCRISENSIFQLTEIVKKIDDDSPAESPLTRNQVNEFIIQLEQIKNHPSITLSTIHGMKGLEADYIFLIFCDQKVLPKKEKFKSDWEEREEKNLFFTAITRPKISLYITTSSERECSPFIDSANLNLDLVELIKKF